jgi:hypothetical protein
VLDKVLLQQVILTYLERRYYIKRPTGSPAERLAAVREKAVDYILPLQCELQRHLNRYAMATGKEKEQLAIEIRVSSTDLACMERGVDKVVAAVVYHSWLLGQTSIEVAEALGLQPPHVRQMISRLHRAWFMLSGERPASRYDAGGTCEGMTTRWSPDKLRTLFARRASGQTFKQIGKAFGIGERTAHQTYERHFMRDFRPLTPTGRRVRLSRIPLEDGGVTLRYENV